MAFRGLPLGLVAALGLLGCSRLPNAKPLVAEKPPASPRRLLVRWERLVGRDGRTCSRCAATGANLSQAVETLRRELASRDITVELERGRIAPAAFARDPSRSNRIYVAGRPLENWLGGRSGLSPCASCDSCTGCEASQCRTVEVEGQTFETVPAPLIVEACRRAAAALFP